MEDCHSWRSGWLHQNPCVSQVNTNNQSDTVLNQFLEAVQGYGLPSRVRSTIGGENVQVSMFMLQHKERGPGRGSMIVGRSVQHEI